MTSNLDLPSYDETSPLSPGEMGKLPTYEETIPEVSKKESFVRGAAQGATMGFADELTAALESMATPKTYEQARGESREAYKEAQMANPKTYMGGEFAGAGATALVPGLGEMTIPKMAAQGALYGLGSSEADLTKGTAEEAKQATKDVLTGGAVGAVGGVIGKGLEAGVTKVIPKIAKWATASIIPEKEAMEAVIARLTNPEEIKNALTTPGVMDKLVNTTNKALTKAGELSEAAQGALNPTKVTNTAELVDAFKDVQSQFMTEGIPSGEAQEAALAALNKWKGVIRQHLKANEGDLPDTTLAKLIRDMRKETNYNPLTATAADNQANKALKALNTRLDKILKDNNPEYAEAMIPVDELMQGISKVENLFNLIKGKGGEIAAGKMTESRVANALGPNKTYTQEALEHLKNLTGEDLLSEMEKSQLRNVFESGKKGGFGLQAWGTGIGATMGRLFPVPGGALAGGAVGGLAANAAEGGRIAAALIDKWLAVRNSATSGAIMKYGPLLADAAKRGGNALASTHFVLSTSDPEYQKLSQEIQENK
jgi:hypothetical protein